MMKKIDDIRTYINDNSGKLLWFACRKYKKVTAIVANGSERVQTVLKDGTAETDVRTASAGDYIITNPDGEQYIVSPEKFESRYEILGNNGEYSPKCVPMYAAKTFEDIEFSPPTWGGDIQRLAAGGFLMRNPADKNDIYGIAKDEFANTYCRFSDGEFTVRNADTEMLSEICRKANCPFNDVSLWKDTVHFNNPIDLNGCGMIYTFSKNGWVMNTKSSDPWNKKILNGLNRYFKNGIDAIETAD